MIKQIDIVEDPHAAADIDAELLRTLRESLPQAKNTSLTFAARDNEGQLVGGVSGSTAYGWLLIKTLWVCADARLHGLGSWLLTAAENKGRDTGCHSAWLDTSSPEAMSFYEKRGYRPIGQCGQPVSAVAPANLHEKIAAVLITDQLGDTRTKDIRPWKPSGAKVPTTRTGWQGRRTRFSIFFRTLV